MLPHIQKLLSQQSAYVNGLMDLFIFVNTGINVLNITFICNSSYFFLNWWLPKNNMLSAYCTFVHASVRVRPNWYTNTVLQAIAFYGILDKKGKGLPLPEGAAFDKDGQPTIDPDAVLGGGTLVPFGGHKGAALALAVELIGATLANAGVAGDNARPKGPNWGHTVIAFTPELLIPDFPSRASAVLRSVKQSAATARLPGERSAANAAQNEKNGTITLPATLWSGIRTLAAKGAATAVSPASKL